MGSPKLIALNEATTGDCIKITQVNITGAMRRRLFDLGFVPSALVTVLQKSPLGDPIAIRVSNTTIALRKEESSNILGELVSDEG